MLPICFQRSKWTKAPYMICCQNKMGYRTVKMLALFQPPTTRGLMRLADLRHVRQFYNLIEFVQPHWKKWLGGPTN